MIHPKGYKTLLSFRRNNQMCMNVNRLFKTLFHIDLMKTQLNCILYNIQLKCIVHQCITNGVNQSKQSRHFPHVRRCTGRYKTFDSSLCNTYINVYLPIHVLGRWPRWVVGEIRHCPHFRRGQTYMETPRSKCTLAEGRDLELAKSRVTFWVGVR